MSNVDKEELRVYCINDVIGLKELYYKKSKFYIDLTKNKYFALYKYLSTSQLTYNIFFCNWCHFDIFLPSNNFRSLDK
jgi:hypothetical protein